jgi:hypothetical protein
LSGNRNPEYTDTAHSGGDQGGGRTETSSVTVTIADRTTKQPLSGALVRLGSFGEMRTDGDGKAVFSNVERGTYNVTVSLPAMPNLRPLTEALAVTSNSVSRTIEVDTTESYAVVFNVRNNGLSVEGAQVTLAGRTQYTDQSGRASFEGLVSGTYSYTVKLSETGDEQLGTLEVTHLNVTRNINF